MSNLDDNVEPTFSEKRRLEVQDGDDDASCKIARLNEMKANNGETKKVIFPFLRAHKRWFAKVKSTPNHLLDELEEQSACDCYIKVKEGYIPAHSILLHKSKVIKQAFKSNMSESSERVFSMEVWDTNLVLDIIECLYTDSFQHLPTTIEKFKCVHMLDFLDFPGMALKLVEYISNTAADDLVSSQEMKNADLFICVWIVEEAFAGWKGKSPIVIANACKFFQNAVFLINAAALYLCNFSSSTMLSLFSHCSADCGGFNWQKVLSILSIWIHWDVCGRVLQVSQLLKYVCVNHLNCSQILEIMMHKHAFYNHDEIHPKISKFRQMALQIVEDKNDDNWISITPFTLYDNNNNSTTDKIPFNKPQLPQDIDQTYLMMISMWIHWLDSKGTRDADSRSLLPDHKCTTKTYPSP